MNLLLRPFCSHDITTTISNFRGDHLILSGNGNEVYRSVGRCDRCGKLIYRTFLDSDCNVVNYRYKNK